MATNYIVSAQKPTVVTHAVVGNLTGPSDLNLALAKVSRVELFIITPEGLKLMREIPIYGRIAVLKRFRAKDETLDSLLILTVKYHMSIISFTSDGDVITRATGCIFDRIGRPSETGIIACIHPSGLMAFRLYDGVLKIVQWSEGKDLRGFNVRCDELSIYDITFLFDTGIQEYNSLTDRPVLAYIYQDYNGRHLKSAELNLEDKEIGPLLWKHDNIEAEASMIIPVPQPCGGCLVVGRETISYYRGSPPYDFCAFAHPLMNDAQINCYGEIDRDGQRFLLGDLQGRLFILLLNMENVESGKKTVKELKLELLGETSIPECLVYVDNGVVFVGSRFGDSQLIRLSTEPRADGTFVTLLDTFTNLSPIRDMVIVNADGQQHVVTCSGAFKDGSLRIIRSGIGIEELASVELSDIKALFALKVNSKVDNYVVISFYHRTYIFEVAGEDLSNTQLEGFTLEEQTHYMGNTDSGTVVQITPSKIISRIDGSIRQWLPPSQITHTAVNDSTGQIVIACTHKLFYIKLTSDIQVVTETEIEDEFACLDISSVGDDEKSQLCAAGYWDDLSVALLTLPDFKEVVRVKTLGDMLARSLLLAKMENNVYFLSALGDGTLQYYQIDMQTGAIVEPKKATLGTQPMQLRKFGKGANKNVFVCSDRPAVIYSSNQKLIFSNVNLKTVTCMSPLDTEAYPNSMILSDGESLVIGRIDDIQKLHIRTVPLGESPCRIAHQPESNIIAVLTQRIEKAERNGARYCRPCASKSALSISKSELMSISCSKDIARSEEIEVSSLVIFDANTLEILHSHELGDNELAISLESCHLGQDSQPYLVVGTAIIHADEAEAKAGRLLVFEVTGTAERLRLVHEKEVKGAAYDIQTLLGKLVVAINSSVRLFEWLPNKELRLECSDFDNVAALYLKTKNDLILVGDLMRSLSLLAYKPMESSFEKIARDHITNWMSACEIIDTDRFLGAENSYNLFTVVRESVALSKEDTVKLQEVGKYYLGETVNVFCHGSLLASHVDLAPPISESILYGTADGGLGIIVQLPDDFHKFLSDLEKRLENVTANCLRITHEQHRTFETERRSEAPTGFVDGDFVESVLNMSRNVVERLAEGLKLPAFADQEAKDATADDILKIVEDLSRIH